MKSVKLATELIAENGSHQSIFRQRGEGGDSFPPVCLQSWCESEGAVKDYGWVIIQYSTLSVTACGLRYGRNYRIVLYAFIAQQIIKLWPVIRRSRT